MSLSKPDITQYSARLVLLIGMLASLCLSTGEGISLLPLPISGERTSTTQLVQERRQGTSTPSAHQSGSGLMRSIKLNKRNRRDLISPEQAAISRAARFSSTVSHLKWVDEVLHHSLRSLRASLADRAPPAG